MRLRLRTPDGGVVPLGDTLQPSSTIGDLKNEIESKTSLATGSYIIKSGFPPKKLDESAPNIASAGLRDGEQLVIERTGSAPDSVSTPFTSTSRPPANDRIPFFGMGHVVVREMPDDNSCLFHSIGYIFERPNLDGVVRRLRSVVAQRIAADPITFNDAILGRPVAEYIAWIQRPDSWGGAIELAVLSAHYKATITSVDVATGRVDTFGQTDDVTKTPVVSACVLYSGIHYDAVVVEGAHGGVGDVVTRVEGAERAKMFIEAATVLASVWKMKRKYTDLATFTLRCSICKIGLKGQKEAQAHAIETKHEQFQEY